MEIDEVDSKSLAEVVLAEDRGVMIDFWGTWCQPCRTLRPHLEGLADEYADSWRMVAVLVDRNEDVVAAYDIRSTPTFVFLKGGDEVARITGAVPTGEIAETMALHR